MTPSRISPPDTGHMPDLLPFRRTHLACRRRCPVPSQESQGACPPKKTRSLRARRGSGGQKAATASRSRTCPEAVCVCVGGCAPDATPRHAPCALGRSRSRRRDTEAPGNRRDRAVWGRPSLLRTTAVPALLCWCWCWGWGTPRRGATWRLATARGGSRRTWTPPRGPAFRLRMRGTYGTWWWTGGGGRERPDDVRGERAHI